MLTCGQVATKRCDQALKQSQEDYKALLAKYNALKGKCDDDNVTSAQMVADPYVIVLIDVHSHRV
jgi:hypothetical protein